jgi:protein FrlC
MKFAWGNYHYIRYSLDKFFDKVMQTPFSCIELYLAAPHLNVYDYSLQRLLDIDREINKRKLEIVCVTPENCIYPVNLSSQESDLRNASLRYYQRVVDTAEFLGVRRIQFCLGYGYFDSPAEEAWKLAKDSLYQIGQYAKRKGVTLILEVLKVTTSNVINTSKQLARMLDETGMDNVVGMLDTDQMALCNETPDDYFQSLGSRLQHIHFNDQAHTVPGDGNLSMKEYYDRIIANGYNGTCSFELCDRKYYCEPDKAVDQTLQWLRQNTNVLGTNS